MYEWSATSITILPNKERTNKTNEKKKKQQKIVHTKIKNINFFGCAVSEKALLGKIARIVDFTIIILCVRSVAFRYRVCIWYDMNE